MPVAEECPLNGPQTGCPARRSPAVCDEQKVRADAEQLGHVSAAAGATTLAVALHRRHVVLLSLDSDQTRVLEAPDNRVSALGYSPDSSRLAIGYVDGSLRQWNVRNGRQHGPAQQALDGFVDSVAYNDSGNLLVTGGNGFRLWDAPSGRSLAPVLSPASDTQTAAAFVAGDRVRAVQGNGDVTEWNVAAGTWRQQACALGGRLSRSEWDQHLPGRNYRPTCP